MASRQPLTPLTSIVEAAGLSQVVASLTSGLFSSTQLPPSLVTTLTQAGSSTQSSLSAGSEVSSLSNDSVELAGINPVTISDVVSTRTQQDISQMQSNQSISTLAAFSNPTNN